MEDLLRDLSANKKLGEAERMSLAQLCLVILADLVESGAADHSFLLQLLKDKYGAILSLAQNTKHYLRLLGTCREDLHDFPLVRGRFYNFAEDEDDQLQDQDSSKSNILWAF